MTEYIEYSGTGGGLYRPLFAEFLAEAAGALDDRKLKALSDRYAELGRQWSALADAALPDAVPAFRKAKEQLAQEAKVEPEMTGGFPLGDAESAALRRELKGRVAALYEGEVAGLEALRTWL